MDCTSNEAAASAANCIKESENKFRVTSDADNYHPQQTDAPRRSAKRLQKKTAADVNILHQSQFFDVYRHQPVTSAVKSPLCSARRRSGSRDDEQETEFDALGHTGENDRNKRGEILGNSENTPKENSLRLPPLTNVFEIVKRRRSARRHRRRTPVLRATADTQLDDVIYNVIKRIQPEKVEALKEREIIKVDDQIRNPRRRCHRRRSSVESDEYHECDVTEVQSGEIGAKSTDADYRSAHSVRRPVPYGSRSFQPSCNYRSKAKCEESGSNVSEALRGSNGLGIGEEPSITNRPKMSPFPTSYYVREIHANRENAEHLKSDGDRKQDRDKHRVKHPVLLEHKLLASGSCQPGRQMTSGDWNVAKIWNRPADQLNVSPLRMAKQDIPSAGAE